MLSKISLDISRACQLVWMLAKYLLPLLARRVLALPQEGPTFGSGLRRLIEEMGITYIKLGQFLAMRFDLLPMEVCRELGRLFEQVPPISFAAVQQTLEAELGGPLTDFFDSFDPACVSSASVAQVHKAVAFDGELLAVKVQRPGIDAIFAADIRNLRRLGWLADWFRLGSKISLTEVINEFADFTTREMDFITEGQTAERLRRHAQPSERIPRIRWELTTRRVLTMEFLHGVSLAKVCDLLERGERETLHNLLPHLDVTLAARHLAMATMRQLFVSGFFHADPHPGNILICDDAVIEFVDFGIFGTVTAEQRQFLSGYIEQLALGNIEASCLYFSRLAVPTADTDCQAYKRDLKDILARWYQASRDSSAPVEQRHLGRYMLETIQLLRRHHLRLSVDTLLFWRALITLDASAMRLSRQLDLLETMREFFQTYRQTVFERIIGMVFEREKITSGLKMASRTPARALSLINVLGDKRDLFQASVESDLRRRRDERGRYRQITLCLMAVGFVVLASGLPIAAAPPYVLWVAAVALVVVAAFLWH